MLLYDNFDLTPYADDARELLTEDGESVTDAKIYSLAAEYAAEDFNIIFDDLTRHFDKLGGRVLAVGRVGTWRGTFDGERVFDDFAAAFYALFRYCDYIKITDDGGRLFIEGAHHDGGNYAEFVTLTERGAALLAKWSLDYSDERTEKQIHNIIFLSNLFSKIPHFARDYYGAKEQRRRKK